MAGEGEPVGGGGPVIRRVSVCVGIVAVDVRAEGWVPACASIALILERADKEVEAGNGMIMRPTCNFSISAVALAAIKSLVVDALP